MSATAGFDAVVLAGGASRRWGGTDKLSAVIDGRTVLDWTIGGLVGGGAGQVICAGPRRPAAVPGVIWCVEDPPGAGPVAGLALGVTHVRTALCWVCAADQAMFAGAMPALGEALGGSPHADVAVLTAAGRRQPLAALWRTVALARQALAHRPDAAVGALFDGVAVVEVDDSAQWTLDCDTSDQLTALADAIRRHHPGR